MFAPAKFALRGLCCGEFISWSKCQGAELSSLTTIPTAGSWNPFLFTHASQDCLNGDLFAGHGAINRAFSDTLREKVILSQMIC